MKATASISLKAAMLVYRVREFLEELSTANAGKRRLVGSCREVCHALAILLAVHFGVYGPALAQAPVFVTQTPITGNSGNVFFVFLPVANVGSDAASNMQLTSVVLTFLGSPAAAVIQPATLPFVLGSGYLGPGGVRKLDLEFANSSLVSGNRYMVELGGTYQVNGTTSSFVLTQPVVYAAGFSAPHQQVLDVITAKFQSVPGLDPDLDNQALLAFVSGLPQISAAGVGATSSLVWAQFADTGRKLVILNNRRLEAPGSVASAPLISSAAAENNAILSAEASVPSTIVNQAIGAPTELPQSIKARLLNGFGSGISNPVADIHAWLVDKQGYSDPIGADASVAGLRNVGGDGVFYINSHGGADAQSGIDFHIWTSTPTTDDCLPPSTICPDPLLPGDILNGRVDEFIADNQYDPSTQEFTRESHYSIYATKFATTYWGNFSANAFVFVDICDSEKNDASVQAFKNALVGLGASVYAGWTGRVTNRRAADSARLVFDRLVGANQFCPENGQPCAPGPANPPTFAQRAFEYPAVQQDLRMHNLGVDGGANLIFEPLTGSFGLLAPTISNMSVDESKLPAGQLTINGVFGQDIGSVQVGGADAHIASWGPKQIVVDLTLSGPGSAGDVQVTVRGHKSNVARLTDWRSNSFTYTFKENGTLQIQTIYNLHFRADIRKYRKIIHFQPDEPSGGILSANDSTATFTGSGSGPAIMGEGEFTLTGSGALANFFVSPTDNYLALGVGSVDNSTQWTFVALGAFSISGCTCTFCAPVVGCSSHPSPVAGPSNQPNPPAGPVYFTFILDADSANIQSGSGQLAGFMLCNNGGPGATGTFQWGPVAPTPDTAPDPKSGR